MKRKKSPLPRVSGQCRAKCKQGFSCEIHAGHGGNHVCGGFCVWPVRKRKKVRSGTIEKIRAKQKAKPKYSPLSEPMDAQPLTPNAGEVLAGQDGGTLAELIANSLGAAEMLSGPVRDAVPVIEKVLAASAPAGKEGTALDHLAARIVGILSERKLLNLDAPLSTVQFAIEEFLASTAKEAEEGR